MDVTERLRAAGYRLTTPRRAVLAVMADSEHHLSAERIQELAAEYACDVNLASVYRTLTLLDGLGLANEVRLGDARGYWELAHDEGTYHLHCTSCHRVAHHDSTVVEGIREHLAANHGFAADAVDLVVHGRCADCAAADEVAHAGGSG